MISHVNFIAKESRDFKDYRSWSLNSSSIENYSTRNLTIENPTHD